MGVRRRSRGYMPVSSFEERLLKFRVKKYSSEMDLRRRYPIEVGVELDYQGVDIFPSQVPRFLGLTDYLAKGI